MDITVPTYDAINTTLSKSFQDGVAESLSKPGVFKPLYTNVPSSGRMNVYQWLNNVPTMREWMKGSERVYRNVETKDFSVSNRMFEATVSIPLIDVEDNQLGTYGPLAKDLGYEATRLPDQLIGDLLNGAFDSTQTYDGEYWCSNSHTVGASTIDNLTSGALSYSTYVTAYQMLLNFKFQSDKDSAKVPVNTDAKFYLVVPPALYWTAVEIVNLETVYQATYATKNPFYKSAEIIKNGYSTSDTAWFLFAMNSNRAPIFYQERQKPVILEKTPANSDVAFNRNEWIWGVHARGAALATFPWQVVGSPGT